jgi:hypothetical protein
MIPIIADIVHMQLAPQQWGPAAPAAAVIETL